MEIACLSLTHHEATVEIRELVSLSAERCKQAHEWNLKQEHIPGLVIVSTCNRTEFYCVVPKSCMITSGVKGPRELIQDLYQAVERSCPEAVNQFTLKTGSTAIEHLFSVASGLDSMIVGETEIFGQVKQAYALATQHGRVEKLLHRLFQCAFRAGKKVREETDITRGAVSVGASAAELAQQLFGELHPRRALLLGAGDTAEKCARALITRGLQSLCVANRTLAHAQTLAESLGTAQAIPLELWRDELHQSDIVITAISSDTHVIHSKDHTTLKRRAEPLFLIDLAMPRNIDPAFGQLDNVFLYNLDDLSAMAEKNLAERRAAIAEGEKIIAVHTVDYIAWVQRLAPGSNLKGHTELPGFDPST